MVTTERRNPAELPKGAERWWFLGAQAVGLALGFLAARVLPSPWGLALIVTTAASLPLFIVTRRWIRRLSQH